MGLELKRWRMPIPNAATNYPPAGQAEQQLCILPRLYKKTALVVFIFSAEHYQDRLKSAVNGTGGILQRKLVWFVQDSYIGGGRLPDSRHSARQYLLAAILLRHFSDHLIILVSCQMISAAYNLTTLYYAYSVTGSRRAVAKRPERSACINLIF
jgi:hypothetical protein